MILAVISARIFANLLYYRRKLQLITVLSLNFCISTIILEPTFSRTAN